MNITYRYDNTEDAVVANELARARGYEGYGHIDDPILREWIWEKAAPYVKRIPRIELSLPEALTPVVVVSFLALLLGIMF